MRNVFTKKLTVFVILILLLSCGSGERSLSIGMVVSLTGKYSSLLTSARNGALLAVEEINNENELKIALTIKDDESDRDIIKGRVKELLEEDVKFLVMAVVSSNYGEAADLIDGSDVLALSSTVSSEVFTGKDDNLIRTEVSSSTFGTVLGKYASENGVTNALIIADGSNQMYSQSLSESFVKQLNGSGLPKMISRIIYNTLNNPNFKDIAAQASDIAPDTVLVIANPFDSALIFQHMSARPRLKLIAPWGLSNEFIENGGQAVEGVVAIVSNGGDSESDAYADFVNVYHERFGTEPTFQSVKNYDLVKLLYQTAVTEKKMDPGRIKNEIISKGRYSGVNLDYSFDKYGDCTSGMTAYTIIDGEIQLLNY